MTYFCMITMPKAKNTEEKIKNTDGIPNIITLSKYLSFRFRLGISSKSTCSSIAWSHHPPLFSFPVNDYNLCTFRNKMTMMLTFT